MQNFKNENNNNYLGDFYKVRKANKAAVCQLYEDLANSICSRQKHIQVRQLNLHELWWA